MKRVFFLIFVLFATQYSFSQQTYPNVQGIGNPNSLLKVNGGEKVNGSFNLGHFADTIAANLAPYVKYYGNGLITTPSKVWQRNNAATKWILIASSDNSPPPSYITILTDSSISICNVNSCDTIVINTVSVSSVTILNDSTLLVCDGSNVCDTIRINPTPLIKPFVDSITIINNSDYYWKEGIPHLIGVRGAPSIIRQVDSTHIEICNVNSCDTITTTVNPQVITIVNDSTIIVCSYGGSCATIHINPTPLIPARVFVDSIYSLPAAKTDTLVYNKNGDSVHVKVYDRNCGLLDPGIVTYDSLLRFSVSPSIYILCSDGIRRTSSQTQVTLAAAHASLDRYDAIILDINGVNTITGTAAATPELPQIAPNQILLSYINVPAAATSIPACSTPDITIYDENTGSEWTPDDVGFIVDFGSTVNPYHLLKAAESGTIAANSNMLFTPSTPITVRSYTYVKFAIALKGAFLNPNGFQLSWVTPAGNSTVNIVDGLYGYRRKTVIGEYIVITVPITAFTAPTAGIALQMTIPSLTKLKINFPNSNADGVYVDYIQLGGSCIVQPPVSGGNVYTVSTRNGTGAPVLAGTVGNDFQFKRIVGVSPIIVTNYADSITVGGGGSSIINIINDTTFNICSFGTNLCDTFVTINRIGTLTVIDDSTILVCDSLNVCDTVHLGSSYTFYSGLGDPTFVVAASNSPTILKNRADYICTGVNDQQVINSAIALGNVTLVEGTYDIRKSIKIPSHRTLTGTGKGTVLLANGMGTGFAGTPDSTNVMVWNSGTEGISVKNLTVNGNVNTKWAILFQSVGAGIGDTAHAGVTVQNVYIKNIGSSGIELRNCWNNIITGNTLNKVYQDGITLTRTSGLLTTNTVVSNNVINGGFAAVFLTFANNTLIQNNICNNQIDQSIQIESSNNVTIEGNMVQNGDDYLISVTSCTGVLINGNYLNTNTGGGEIIGIYSSPATTVSNNQVLNSSRSGIRLDDSNNSMVSDNYVIGSSTSGNNSYSGITISSSSRVIISNNTVRKGANANKPKYGIEVFSGTDIQFIGNNLYDAGITGDLSSSGGTTPRIRDNIGITGTWIASDSLNTPTNVLWEHPVTKEILRGAYPTGIADANNGDTVLAGKVGIGGQLIRTTIVNGGVDYQLTFTGAQPFSNTVQVTNTGATGNALHGTANGTGTGVYGVSGSGTGIGGFSTLGIAGLFDINPASTNTAVEMVKLQRESSGTPAAGIGGYISYWIKTASGTNELANKLTSKWTTATTGTPTSQFIISGKSGGTEADILTLNGNKSIKANGYGLGTFTGTPAYTLQVDASGNIIEGTASSGGITTADNGLTANTSSNVQLGATNNSGSPLLHNTWINADAFSLTVRGSSFPFLTESTGVGGYGAIIEATGLGGTGLGVNSTGLGINSYSSTQIAGAFTSQYTTTNSSEETIRLDRQTTGTAANGIGNTLSFFIETSNNTSQPATELKSIWTGATHATRTSQFSITGVNSATTGTILSIEGNGATTFYGSLIVPYVAKTSTYSITSADYTIDCTSGTFTATLPTAVGISGRLYVVKNSGAGVITIACTGGQTIDGSATQTLAAGQSYTVQSNNVNWIIL